MTYYLIKELATGRYKTLPGPFNTIVPRLYSKSGVNKAMNYVDPTKFKKVKVSVIPMADDE